MEKMSTDYISTAKLCDHGLSSPNTAGAADAAKASEAELHVGEDVIAQFMDTHPGMTGCVLNDMPDEEQKTALAMGFSEPCLAMKDTGKCPKGGCIKQVGDKWKVISNKTGRDWPQEYSSRKDAAGAIAGYHMSHKG